MTPLDVRSPAGAKLEQVLYAEKNISGEDDVGQNGNRDVCQGIDRWTGRNLGVARLVAPT